MNTDEKPVVPVTVIGGYLGAGKTTLVNHLLRNADGQKLAILVNEFGELPIDADLIEAEDESLISLAGGCICCSYGNDLVAALIELSKMDPRPDHVVLEASGVAIPASIAGSISLLSEYSMDGIVVLVDALNVMERAADTYLSDTILRQIADSDIILLSKADLVDQSRLEKIMEWLRSEAPNAQSLVSSNANVPNEVILQRHQMRSPNQRINKPEHLAGFHSEVIVPNKLVDPYGYGLELIARNPTLIRAKGFVLNLSGEMMTIQIVGKRLDISDAPSDASAGIMLILKDNFIS